MPVPFLNLIVLPLRFAIWTAENPPAFFTVLGLVMSALIFLIIRDFRENRF